MNKIITSLNSINSFSKKVIFYGCTIVLIACISSICLIAINSAFIHDASLYDIGVTMIQKFTRVFTYVIIAALLMDWFGKMSDEE